MNHFRGTGNSKMDNNNVGVGSTLEFEHFLLIIAVGGNTINILNLTNFQIEGENTVVEDIHHLSTEEIRSCTNKLQLAFSDFTFDSKGLKGFKIK